MMTSYRIAMGMAGGWAFATLLALASSAAEPEQNRPQEAPPKGAASKLKVLSEHRTLATFTGSEYRLCRGRTSLCPEKCGDSGEFAQFKIADYLSYRKLGEFGDPKQSEFLIQFSDFNRQPTGDPKLNKTIRGLKPGDTVVLSWDHRYGEVLPGNFAPTRPVLELRPITAQEAAKLRQSIPAEKPVEKSAAPAEKPSPTSPTTPKR